MVRGKDDDFPHKGNFRIASMGNLCSKARISKQTAILVNHGKETLPKTKKKKKKLWMQLFFLQLEASCLQWSFLTYS